MTSRTSRRTGWLATLMTAIAACGATVESQHTFTMDYSASAAPNAGWPAGSSTGAYEDRSTFSVTRLDAGGPSGQPAYQMRLDHDGAARSFGGQFNWGWRAILEPQPTYGSTQYYRWRMKVDATTNYRCRDWEDGSSANCIDKVLIVNDGCKAESCRPILSLESDARSSSYILRIQKDGGADLADTPSYREGAWLDVQLRITWSSSEGARDGGYALWVNANAQGKPTAERKRIVVNAGSAPGYTRFGSFMNHGVAADGVYAWTHSDFRTSPTFDAAWHAGGKAAGLPSLPSASGGQYAPAQE